ncbi:hypothetical protein BH11VER1_BH11VER1_39810 [soil metagenome]
MTDCHEELAALYALRMLNPEEAQAFEAEMQRDGALRELVASLEMTGAEMALLMPHVEAPPDLRAQIMSEVKSSKRVGVSIPQRDTFRLIASPWLAWTAAIALAVGSFSLWNEKERLQEKVAALMQSETVAQQRDITSLIRNENLEKQMQSEQQKMAGLADEITRLNQTNALARMEVATLRSSISSYENGVAVIVWDNEKQEGKLKLEKMPPVQANKDYQLWVVDKQNPTQPVSAGVVKLSPDGTATMSFKPVQPISSATAFALSVETEGGIPRKTEEGPIVLIGSKL